jgi:hypothetical protein
MEKIKFSRILAALGALAIAGASEAYAIEPGSNDPHLLGITSNLPLGALPPPGFYLSNNLAYLSGSLKNGNGNNINIPGFGVNALAYVDEPVLSWVAPFKVVGASFGAFIIEPFVTASVTANTPGAGQVTSTRTGLFNTIFSPAELSWQLPLGFFVSAYPLFYVKDGDTGDTNQATRSHIANNTWTFAPSAAVSWFNGKGLEATLNGEYDIQTQNDSFVKRPFVTVKYQSGDILNLDFGVHQTLGKWTIGAVGYYGVQTSDDQTTTSIAGLPTVTATVPASLINGKGNLFEKFALGPSAGYDFGPVSVNLRYTHDIYAKNATQNDTVFFFFALPL